MLQVPTETEEPQSTEALQRQRPLKRAGIALIAFIVLLLLAAGGIYWQATTSSIKLAFITGRVEAALLQRLPADARVSVKSTAVSYREGQGIILRIKGLELALPGTARVSADELSTNTTASALLRGRIDL